MATLRSCGLALLAVPVSSLLCGCTMLTWDDVTSRDFSVRSLWTAPPPPLLVIEKSTDGFARAKAFNKLDEPSNPAELDTHLRVLQQAALNDRDPLCRIAALRTLARYKDPRAPKILTEIYLGNPGMSAENNAFIRQQALTSLQASAPAEAKQLFIQAAKQPAGSLTGQAQRDRLEILDERLTAIRALGKYPQPDAVETLVKLLETEKDIAIRKCAQESLTASTGKDFPPDGKVWREYVASGKEPPRPNAVSAKLAKMMPPSASLPNSPVIDTIANWVKPEKNEVKQVSNPTPSPRPQTPRQMQSTQATPVPNLDPVTPPGTAPATLPPTSLPPTSSNQPRIVPPTPAGATRNAQGELIVPATP